MMEADREGLCGPKGRHQANRRAWRGGSTSSRVTLGGRQVELARLRVRSHQGEAALASFQWASATDAMDAHTLEAIAAGVSTRRYRQTLDPLPEAMDEHCTSRSAVSRRFVALSRKRMHEFLSRPLPEPSLLRHVSPLGWDHIVLTGDYDWNSGAAERSNVRPLNLYPAKIRA